MVNNWTLPYDRFSPALKHKTKHSHKTFKKNFIKKIKHKNVNLCDKKSQSNEKKNNKIVNLCGKKSQFREKSHEIVNLCDKN